jgi:hypothetical protein
MLLAIGTAALGQSTASAPGLTEQELAQTKSSGSASGDLALSPGAWEPAQIGEVRQSTELELAQKKLDLTVERCTKLEAQIKRICWIMNAWGIVCDYGLINKLPPLPPLKGDASNRTYYWRDGPGTRVRDIDPLVTLTSIDCAGVYRDTIDAKVSDLTNRQAEQIKACKSLDLYPPDK